MFYEIYLIFFGFVCLFIYFFVHWQQQRTSLRRNTNSFASHFRLQLFNSKTIPYYSRYHGHEFIFDSKSAQEWIQDEELHISFSEEQKMNK